MVDGVTPVCGIDTSRRGCLYVNATLRDQLLAWVTQRSEVAVASSRLAGLVALFDHWPADCLLVRGRFSSLARRELGPCYRRRLIGNFHVLQTDILVFSLSSYADYMSGLVRADRMYGDLLRAMMTDADREQLRLVWPGMQRGEFGFACPRENKVQQTVSVVLIPLIEQPYGVAWEIFDWRRP